MAAPVADTYAAASGAILRAGRFASRLSGGVALADVVGAGALASNLSNLSGGVTLADAVAAGTLVGLFVPAWVAGATINAWTAISGSTPLGRLDDFSGAPLRDQRSVGGGLYVASVANGGHLDSADNGVYQCRLDVDSPTWSTLKAATAGGNVIANAAYNADGLPAARHTYWMNHWVPEISGGRYMMMGAMTVYGGAVANYNTVDGFDPVNNTWDAAGTYANLPLHYFYTTRDPSTGIIYGLFPNTLLVWFNPSNQTYGSAALTGTGSVTQGGIAFDSTRSALYNLASNDNFSGGSSTIISTKVSLAGARTAITLSGSGWSQFQTDAPGMLGSQIVYDPVGDVYYFYAGNTAGTAGRLYRVTPNGTSSWTIDIVATTGSVPTAIGGGPNGKLYFIQFGAIGIVMVIPTNTDPIYFVRVR